MSPMFEGLYEHSFFEVRADLKYAHHTFKWRIASPTNREARVVSILIKEHNKKEANMVDRGWKFIRQGRYLVAKDAYGQIMGFLGLIDHGEEGIELVSHFVRKKVRNKKVGQQLFAAALEIVRSMKPQSFFLCTTQVGYYEKIGFRITDSSKYTKKIRRDCVQCKNGPNGPGFPPCPEIVMEYAVGI